MSNIKIETLSSEPSFPFGKSIERFFKKFNIYKDVEYYKLFFCPWGGGTNIEDLSKINYTKKIIILMSCDSFVDKKVFNWYQDTYIKPIRELEKICEQHPDKIFIICSWQYNLNQFIKVKNLYSLELINTAFKRKNKCKRCNKKIFTKKKMDMFKQFNDAS